MQEFCTGFGIHPPTYLNGSSGEQAEAQRIRLDIKDGPFKKFSAVSTVCTVPTIMSVT